MSNSDECFRRLKRAGWSIGDTALAREAGGRVWVVSGRNGENVVRTEGRTRDEAWRAAIEQARAAGMCKRH